MFILLSAVEWWRQQSGTLGMAALNFWWGYAVFEDTQLANRTPRDRGLAARVCNEFRRRSRLNRLVSELTSLHCLTLFSVAWFEIGHSPSGRIWPCCAAQ